MAKKKTLKTMKKTEMGLHDQESAEALATTNNQDQGSQETGEVAPAAQEPEVTQEKSPEPPPITDEMEAPQPAEQHQGGEETVEAEPLTPEPEKVEGKPSEPSPAMEVEEVPQDEAPHGGVEEACETEPASPESETVEAESSEPPLPANFTEAPQHPEHMDLRQVKGHGKWVKAYQKVSDDEGHLLGDLYLEGEVIQFCDELVAMDLNAEEDPDAMINMIKAVIERYQKSVNFAENTSIGVITKYRLRLGMLYNHLKFLVKKRMGYQWTIWFARNFGASQLRSAEDFMRLAEVPNCIRYAVFGKERLIQILPHLNDPAGEDPIGVFLRENGIDFDPENVSEYTEIRVQTDIAIGLKRLANAGLAEIGRNMVEAFIRKGIELEPKHVKTLKAAKADGEDVLKEMAKLISSGGKVERKAASSPEAKAESFKKALDRVCDMAKDALEDSAYLRTLNLADIRALKNQLVTLENQLAALSMPN